MRAKTINFERGIDPKKSMQIGMVRPYPQMTPESFKEWFEREIVPYLDEDGIPAIKDNLVMNSWESDLDVSSYLHSRFLEYGIIEELIRMREYFNDKNYIKMVPSIDLPETF